MQKLLAVEDRIAVAKALHKKVAEKLRKKQKKLADIKEEIVDAKKEFWKTWFWLNFHKTYNPEEFSTMLEIKNEHDDMKFFNKNYWKIYFSVIIISTLIDPRLTIFFFFVPVIITFPLPRVN